MSSSPTRRCGAGARNLQRVLQTDCAGVGHDPATSGTWMRVCRERTPSDGGAELHRRWRRALRSRLAGGGSKLPQAAPVKSRCGERCGKGVRRSASGENQEDERKRTSRRQVEKRSTDIKTGVARLSRDKSGGDLLTAQVVSGLKVARAWFRLLVRNAGTCASMRREKSK